MATRYFRLRLDGAVYGLIRRRDDARGIPVELAFVALGQLGSRGEWVRDASLHRYWLDPGDVDLVEVDAAEAGRAASEMGAELAAKATRTAPVEEEVS